MEIAVIILAAGQSKRILSKTPKVLHPLCGKPLLAYPLAVAKALKARVTAVVVPPGENRRGANPIADYVTAQPGLQKGVQKTPLGTGHAVAATIQSLKKFSGHVLILSGDVPLLHADVVKAFVSEVVRKKSKLGLMTTKVPDPQGYGRIVRDLSGNISAIIEEKEASPDVRTITEINPAIYCVEKRWLFEALTKLKRHPVNGEYYLTDIVGLAVGRGENVFGVLVEDYRQCLGINTRAELAEAQELMRKKIVDRWLAQGVGFINPDDTYIDADVVIGADTLIYPNVCLRGVTKVGSDCVLDIGSVISDSILADGVHIKPYSVIESARVGTGAQVGPFARLRPEAVLKEQVRVGNFVEVKKSVLEKGVKANHLSYIGDARVGRETNIGCGTITCNYDGFKKYRTVIGDKVFVGSDVQFVAPVRVGRGAVIGAGSTITKNVPEYALALSRSLQVNKKGWARKRKK